LKWPSLATLWDNTQRVLLRFPLQVIISIVAICICFMLIDLKGIYVREANLVKLLFLCNMAFVLLLAADLFATTHQFQPVKKWLLRLCCLVICSALYFALSPQLVAADRFRIALLIFAFHLLVAFAPFIRNGNLNGFWAYNKILFLQILTAGLYAFVLFAGLSVALMAIDGLFQVKVDSNIYMRLLSVVGIGFTSIFFLSGIPLDFKSLSETQHPYPKGLKIFTQYVLIPLLTIYLAILLVYEVKIIISWEMPNGMVSTLILGYAVFGVLSLLLVYPIREQEGNGWIRLFSKWFYLMMIPLVVLLLLAVWKRVGTYGITESRYILIILALWLSIITAYFLISKKDNIKIIPISLCVLALLATYGPQSAFSVSRFSQTVRLKRMMKANDALAIKERPQIVRYLVLNHGLTSLQSFTKVDLTALNEQMEEKAIKLKQHRIKQGNKLVDTAYALLKIDKSKLNQYGDLEELKSENDNMVYVKGYDYIISIHRYPSVVEHKVNGVAVKITRKDENVTVKFAGEPEIVFNTQAAIAVFKKAYYINETALPDEGLQVHATGKSADFTLMITDLTFNIEEDATPQRDSFSGYLLVKIK
jgi:hypothetical protein